MNIRKFVVTALKKFRQTYDESMPTPTLQQIADNEGGTSVIKSSMDLGDKIETFRTGINSDGIFIETANDKDGDNNKLNITDSNITIRSIVSNKIASAIVGPYRLLVGDSTDALDITVNHLTDQCSVTCSGRMRDAFRTALGIGDTLATRVVGEERLIGEWVEDGVTYDLYEKVINFGALPNDASKTAPHGVANIYRFVKVYGEATSSSASNSIAIPFISGDGTLFTYLGVGKNNITIRTNSDRSGFNAYVYLEFLRARS